MRQFTPWHALQASLKNLNMLAITKILIKIHYGKNL